MNIDRDMPTRAAAADRGSVLVAGTTSDAGKSTLTAGICRWLARQGVSVTPFKAQNMSNNSMVTPDGAEIGRAQAMQAAAAGIPPEAAMNPVLIKSGSDNRSQLVVLGRPVGDAEAFHYWQDGPARARLAEIALSSYDELRARFDVVVCEGAGSPAEINLRRGDFVNMGLARARNVPVIVVGDIDRGGVFAALYGTLALLDRADQALVSGFVINKFRGDYRVLAPGLDQISKLTGRPVFGVVPYLTGVWLDAEDGVAAGGAHGSRSTIPDADVLRVAVIRLPRISNFTDVDALALELPNLCGRDPEHLDGAGIVRAVVESVAENSSDAIESASDLVAGLDLLPVTTRFVAGKTLGRPSGYAGGLPVTGYEIHHGCVEVHGGEPWFTSEPGGGGIALDGCRLGPIRGTLWHGILENDAFRRAYITEVARIAGRDFAPAPDTSFGHARQTQFDKLADAVEDHLDTGALLHLIEHGPTAGMPILEPGS